MSFQPNLRNLRPLIARLVLIAGLCIGGLFWVQSNANPELKGTIDAASPPNVELSVEDGEDGQYYAEYLDPTARTGAGEWIPIPDSTNFYSQGKHRIFIQIPGEPTPKSRILRMVRTDKLFKPTIFPAHPTVCPVGYTQCPAKATVCVTNVATVCPTVAVATTCPAQLTNCATARTQCPAVATTCPVQATVCTAAKAPTACGGVITSCPVLATQCASVVTVCPQQPTQCPKNATQ